MQRAGAEGGGGGAGTRGAVGNAALGLVGLLAQTRAFLVCYMPPDLRARRPAPLPPRGMQVSYKPQKISPKFEGSVRSLLHKKIREMYLHPQFTTDVMKPMSIEPLMDNEVQNLSGRGQGVGGKGT